MRKWLLASACSALLLGGCVPQTVDEGVPGSPVAKREGMLRIARAARAGNDIQSAADLYQKAINDSGNDPAPWVEYSDFLNDTGNEPSAAKLLDEAVRRMPDSVELWRKLGYALIRTGEYSKAVSTFDHAIGMAPEEAKLYAGKGVALDLMDNQVGAQEAYLTGLRKAANDPALLTNLGMSLILSKQYDAAADYLSRVPEGAPAFAKAKRNLALAREMSGKGATAQTENAHPKPVAAVLEEEIAPLPGDSAVEEKVADAPAPAPAPKAVRKEKVMSVEASSGTENAAKKSARNASKEWKTTIPQVAEDPTAYSDAAKEEENAGVPPSLPHPEEVRKTLDAVEATRDDDDAQGVPVAEKTEPVAEKPLPAKSRVVKASKGAAEVPVKAAPEEGIIQNGRWRPGKPVPAASAPEADVPVADAVAEKDAKKAVSKTPRKKSAKKASAPKVGSPPSEAVSEIPPVKEVSEKPEVTEPKDSEVKAAMPAVGASSITDIDESKINPQAGGAMEAPAVTAPEIAQAPSAGTVLNQDRDVAETAVDATPEVPQSREEGPSDLDIMKAVQRASVAAGHEESEAPQEIAQEPAPAVQPEPKEEEIVVATADPVPVTAELPAVKPVSKVVEISPEEPEVIVFENGKQIEAGSAPQEVDVASAEPAAAVNGWFLDLGSFASAEEGKEFGAQLLGMHPDLSASLCCKSAPEGHTQLGPFATFAEVSQACQSLAKNGVVCKIVQLK